MSIHTHTHRQRWMKLRLAGWTSFIFLPRTPFAETRQHGPVYSRLHYIRTNRSCSFILLIHSGSFRDAGQHQTRDNRAISHTARVGYLLAIVLNCCDIRARGHGQRAISDYKPVRIVIWWTSARVYTQTFERVETSHDEEENSQAKLTNSASTFSVKNERHDKTESFRQ